MEELPLQVSASKMGWILHDTEGETAGGDWKVPSAHLAQTASNLLAREASPPLDADSDEADSNSVEDGPFETKFGEFATSNEQIRTRSHQRAIRSTRRLGGN